MRKYRKERKGSQRSQGEYDFHCGSWSSLRYNNTSIARFARVAQGTQGFLSSLRPLRFIAFFAIQQYEYRKVCARNARVFVFFATHCGSWRSLRYQTDIKSCENSPSKDVSDRIRNKSRIKLSAPCCLK